MSNKNNPVRSTLANQEAAAYLNNNDRLYKKSLSFQDTDNVSYLEPNDDDDEFQGKNDFEDQEAPVEIEHTNTATYDRDDSLYDVISFGKQTPFRLEHLHDMNNHELANSNEFKINNPNHNSTLNNNQSILNLKDTTIDDMFLMADNMEKISNNFLQLETSSVNNKKPFLYKSNDFFNRINLNPDFELSFDVDNDKYHQSTTRVHQHSSDVMTTPTKSNNLVNNSILEKQLASPSRIPVLSSRSKSKNLSDSRLLNETNPIGFEEKKEDTKVRPKEESKGKVNGAFKLYSTSNKKNEGTTALKTTKPAVMENDKKETNRMSPFVSLESENKSKHVNESSSIIMGSKQNSKPKNQAVEAKSFKSTLTAANKSVKKSLIKNQPEPGERTRPPTNHDINYSLESDESIMVDNLLNNPVELKKVLREGKMDKEQLNQLQENYLHLLEQYAEKENFIDTFRLGYNLNALNNFQANNTPATPSSNMFQVRV